MYGQFPKSSIKQKLLNNFSGRSLNKSKAASTRQNFAFLIIFSLQQQIPSLNFTVRDSG